MKVLHSFKLKCFRFEQGAWTALMLVCMPKRGSTLSHMCTATHNGVRASATLKQNSELFMIYPQTHERC